MHVGPEKRDSVRLSDNSLFTRKFAMQLICFAIISTIYTLGLLYLTDYGLSKFLKGYIFSGQYGIGVLIFIPVATTFACWAKHRNWDSWKFYVLGALAIFFPLVFFSSAMTVLLKSDGAIVSHYVKFHCSVPRENTVCGEAFAVTVFSMSLRALPTVLTAPALFWFLIFRTPANRSLRS